MPSNTQVLTLPEQAAPQAKLTLDEINASYSFEMMPNSREQTGLKLLDILCDDSAEDYTFPPSWKIIYMSKLVDVLYDENGGALNSPWDVIIPLDAGFIDHLNDIDDIGTRPSGIYEPHSFMGLPKRF